MRCFEGKQATASRPSMKDGEYELDTAMDWSGCLQVEQVQGKVRGAPILKNTRMPADAVVENYETGLPSEVPDMQCSLSVIAHLFRRIDHGTIGRLGKGRVMTSDEIVTMAVRIFGDRESADAWMTTKKASCQGRIPMAMLRTDGGRRMVEGMLTKIETGTFA